MEDPEIEDNVESYIKETYTERRKLPADGVLPPASLPLFVSYTLNTIRDISVSSDTEMFGIEPGNDLSQCFVLADPSYHPYCCMVCRGKKVGAYRTGIDSGCKDLRTIGRRTDGREPDPWNIKTFRPDVTSFS